MISRIIFTTTWALAALAGLLAPDGAWAQDVRPQRVVSGLDHPWSLAFLPDGQMLVTERPGRIRVIDATGRLLPALSGVPDVVAQGQGGLLYVLTDSSNGSVLRLLPP